MNKVHFSKKKKYTPRRLTTGTWKYLLETSNIDPKHQFWASILSLPGGFSFNSPGKLGITCDELVTWSSFHLKKTVKMPKKTDFMAVMYDTINTCCCIYIYIYIYLLVRYTLITKTSRNSTSILKWLSFLLWKKPPCLAQLHIRKVFG